MRYRITRYPGPWTPRVPTNRGEQGMSHAPGPCPSALLVPGNEGAGQTAVVDGTPTPDTHPVTPAPSDAAPRAQGLETPPPPLADADTDVPREAADAVVSGVRPRDDTESPLRGWGAGGPGYGVRGVTGGGKSRVRGSGSRVCPGPSTHVVRTPGHTLGSSGRNNPDESL